MKTDIHAHITGMRGGKLKAGKCEILHLRVGFMHPFCSFEFKELEKWIEFPVGPLS